MLLGGGVEGGVFHAQRGCNVFGEELGKGLAGGDLDDSAEGVDAGLAVGPLGAGLEGVGLLTKWGMRSARVWAAFCFGGGFGEA